MTSSFPRSVRSTRRKMLGQLLAMAGVALIPSRIYASLKTAFEARDADTVLKDLLGDRPLEESDRIVFTRLPDIAEDGAVVSVGIKSDIPGIETVAIVIDNNPNPLSATFDFTSEVPVDFTTRVKMGESSRVRAIAITSDKAYSVSKEVKVTLGGCGG